VILADTSVWVTYLRGSGTPASRRLRGLLSVDDELAISDIVQMEVLAGARDANHLHQLRALLARAHVLAIAPGIDTDHAAEIYRSCRRQGHTPRQLTDCVIAAVAIRNDVAVLHEDRDFTAIARHTELRAVTA
jgi:predicted nucleic acid-binding protein